MASSEVEVEIVNDDIAQRHRREKKLLQNRIQGLKKSSGKLDKKKKKELDELICRLESELEQTHLKELSETNNEEPAPIEESSVASGPPRVTKAQRRRDKKAAEESIREKLIKEQEKINVDAPRSTETRAITKALKERGLAIHNIPSNGDCLYGAVAHQLAETCRSSMSAADLRQATADYIRSNGDNFMPFMCDPNSGDILTEEQFQKYCYDISNTNVWGGQVELQALSSRLRCAIHVIQAVPPTVIIQGEEFASNGAPLIITYHRHMYGLGEHYNSTQKLIVKDDGPEETINGENP